MKTDREIVIEKINEIIEGFKELIEKDIYSLRDGDELNYNLFDIKNNHINIGEEYSDEMYNKLSEAIELNNHYYNCVENIYINKTL